MCVRETDRQTDREMEVRKRHREREEDTEKPNEIEEESFLYPAYSWRHDPYELITLIAREIPAKRHMINFPLLEYIVFDSLSGADPERKTGV